MKKTVTPVVHCEYAEASERLDQLLEASFRLYLARILAGKKASVGNGIR